MISLRGGHSDGAIGRKWLLDRPELKAAADCSMVLQRRVASMVQQKKDGESDGESSGAIRQASQSFWWGLTATWEAPCSIRHPPYRGYDAAGFICRIEKMLGYR